MQRQVFLLEGTSKIGKTTIASTISEIQKGELTDTRYIQLDPGGMDALGSIGKSCEYYDWSELATTGGMDDKSSIREVFARMGEDFTELREEVASGVVKNVILDPLSTLDSLVFNHYSAINDGATAWPAYDSTFNFHHKLLSVVRTIPCNWVITTHQQMEPMAAEGKSPQQVAAAKKDKIKKEALQLAGGATVTLAVSGPKTKELYRRFATIVCSIGMTIDGKRFLWCKPNGKYEAGGRYSSHLEEKEPANLQALLTKVRKGTSV
jgi:hypothetical protein